MEAVHAERPDAIIVPISPPAAQIASTSAREASFATATFRSSLDDKELEGIHGVNERVSLENLDRGLRILMRVVMGDVRRAENTPETLDSPSG